MNQNEDSSQKYHDGRFIAYKLSLFDILTAPMQDYHLLWRNRIMGRVNVVGAVVSIQKKETYHNIFLDDGTGTMCMRLFGSDAPEFGVGEIIQMIGRPRGFGQERYLAPEIVTKIDDPAWIKIRMWERELLGNVQAPNKETAKKEHFSEHCLEMIKHEDKGDGVDVDFLLQHSISEELVHELLKCGVVFETRPGRVKLLE